MPNLQDTAFSRRVSILGVLSAFLVLCGLSCSSPDPRIEGERRAARDSTFFVLSDTHVGAENPKATPPVTRADTLAAVKANLDALRGWVGHPYPERPSFRDMGLGTVATPRGLFVLGDLTDGHKEPAVEEEQWSAFEQLFPVDGVAFAERRVPVYAIAGNHDGEPSGPQRRGLVQRNRALERAGRLAAISPNGVHFALEWEGVHIVCMNLCPAEGTDAETPFKYGKPGPGSWNDPEGALSFLREYLAGHVRDSGEPVVLMHHYGFDGFSMNDWYWWTPRQRRDLYQLLGRYNIAAIFQGHDHHAAHYRWPDPKLHAAEMEFLFDGKVPPDHRQYDVFSCGNVCWVIRIRGQKLIAAHFRGPDWSDDPANFFVKPLEP